MPRKRTETLKTPLSHSSIGTFICRSLAQCRGTCGLTRRKCLHYDAACLKRRCGQGCSPREKRSKLLCSSRLLLSCRPSLASPSFLEPLFQPVPSSALFPLFFFCLSQSISPLLLLLFLFLLLLLPLSSVCLSAYHLSLQDLLHAKQVLYR